MSDIQYCDLCGLPIEAESMKGTTYCSRECARLDGFLRGLRLMLREIRELEAEA